MRLPVFSLAKLPKHHSSSTVLQLLFSFLGAGMGYVLISGSLMTVWNRRSFCGQPESRLGTRLTILETLFAEVIKVSFIFDKLSVSVFLWLQGGIHLGEQSGQSWGSPESLNF